MSRKDKLLLLASLAAPLAWVLQMLASETLSSHACYPKDAPAEAPVFSWLMPALFSVNLFCVLLALGASLLACRGWRDRPAGSPGRENAEALGRRRFVLMLALIAASLFFVATCFTGGAVLLVSPCRKWW